MKSKNQGYVCYSANEINKSVLDSIEVGDLVKVNDWIKPMRVKFVTENGFAMTQKNFRDTYYSIFPKRTYEEEVNPEERGMYRCGADNWICGSDLCNDYEKLYEFENPEASAAYFRAFGDGETDLSMRKSIAVFKLYIKKWKNRFLS